jgi:GNAT superfamily N-acetyltransferase
MGRASEDLAIRAMRADDIAMAVDWAAAEGWNPGLSDARCFASVDAGGFLIAETGGKPAAVISSVNYDERFAFLGFYIVQPELRGRGFGRRLWQAAIAHAGTRTIGLDGVVEQQANYARSGFVFAYNNIRYGGVPKALRASGATVPLAQVPLEAIVADDARVFPAARPFFWLAWLGAPGHCGRAVMRGGELAAWGVIRPCRRGRKIGPLVADDRTAAEAVLAALVGEETGEVFIDVPQPNAAAVAMAGEHGLVPVFETARMYRGPVGPVALNRVFGVTSFELG